MALNYETIKNYSGIQTVIVELALDNENVVQVEVKKFMNAEMKLQVMQNMATLAMAIDDHEELRKVEEIETHVAVIGMLAELTDIEFPPLHDIDKVMEMYLWLTEGGKIEKILSAIPATTIEELMAFVTIMTKQIAEGGFDEQLNDNQTSIEGVASEGGEGN